MSHDARLFFLDNSAFCTGSRGRHCCAEIWPLKYRFCPHCGEILMTNASALAKK